VTRWLSFDSLTREQQAERLTGAIERAAANPQTTDGLIGLVRIGLSGMKAGKLGYAIAADHWGHGYATDAAKR
jgi:RimJ/RimL family protein N-acetyltransferase